MSRLVLPPDADSLSDAVAGAVRDAVAAGELVPEETYSVYQLAEALGVSRSPVREAMLRLAEAGVVEIVRNRGFRVRLPRAHDLQEIFEIRLALEPAAAARAARTDAHDAARHLAAMRTAAHDASPTDFWRHDRALHDSLLRAAGNSRAAAIVDALRSTTALLGPPTTATGRTLVEILAEHEPILAAVAAGDAEAAAAAMRTHLERTRDLLLAGLADPADRPSPR